MKRFAFCSILILLLSSCFRLGDTGTYSTPIITNTDTLYIEPGYDDVFIYNDGIILADRNSGKILTYLRTGLNTFDIEQSLQISVLDEYIYYQSASDWEMYRTDIYHAETERIGIIPEGDIFIPQCAGNYVLLNPAMSTLTNVSGYIQKEFMFSHPVMEHDIIRISKTYIGVYTDSTVILFDYFGNEITSIYTGQIDDFCIAEYGVFAIKNSTIIYADYRGISELIQGISAERLIYDSGRLVLYDSVTGQALSIRLSH